MKKLNQNLIRSFISRRMGRQALPVLRVLLAVVALGFAISANAQKPKKAQKKQAAKNQITIQISKSGKGNQVSVLTKNQVVAKPAQNVSKMKMPAQPQAPAKTAFVELPGDVGTSSMPLNATPAKKPEKAWSILMGLDRSSNMVEADQAESEVSTSFLFAPGYKFNDRFKINGRVAIERVESGPAKGDTQATDPSIGLTVTGWKLTEKLSTNHIFTGVAPGNIDSIQRDRFQGAASIGNQLVMETGFGTYKYTLGVRQNSHEYTINAQRKANIERILSHRVQTDTPIYREFSFSSDLTYRDSWTYEATQKSAFSFSFSLDYAATDALSVSFGLTNEGSALKANGQDSNIELYNERTNVLSLGVTYVL